MNANMEEVEMKFPKCELVCKENLQNCRCVQLEERNKKAEARIVELELEIQKRKRENEAIEAKFKELETKKSLAEAELEDLRTKNDRIKEGGDCAENERKASCEGGKNVDGVVDLTEEEEDEDKVTQLMIENSVLECEKKRAESEVEVWKKKFKELQLWVSQLQTKAKATHLMDVRATSNIPGTPYNDIPRMATPTFVGGKRVLSLESQGECGRGVKKHLSFEVDRSPTKRMAPSTPGVARPACLNFINIHDSDDESQINGSQMATVHDQGNGRPCTLIDCASGGTLDGKKENILKNSLNKTVHGKSDGEDTDGSDDKIPCVSTPKRKRVANIVTSDTDIDEDDNVPISKLKRINLHGLVPDKASSDVKRCSMTATPSRRRLVKLRQYEGKEKLEKSSSRKTHETKYQQGIPTTVDVEDDESEEFGSDSEGESLGGFICDSSDISEGDDVASQSEHESDGNMDFEEILSRLQRSKDHNFKWEFEADMLSAFGKDPELCMKAVCALYRQQTSEEQFSKETMYENNRGFSKFDALRGTTLAEFLTDGDSLGDVKKSAQELIEHDPKAVELCRTLATRYSKQLFEIYKNKEDPLFLPH